MLLRATSPNLGSAYFGYDTLSGGPIGVYLWGIAGRSPSAANTSWEGSVLVGLLAASFLLLALTNTACEPAIPQIGCHPASPRLRIGPRAGGYA